MSDDHRDHRAARVRGLLVCGFAYLVAFAGAWATAHAVAGEHPLVIVAACQLVATVLVFCFSVGANNSSLFDPYWSVAPPVIAGYFACGIEGGAPNTIRAALVFAVVLAWAVRLTYNCLRRWEGLGDEDYRYVQMRRTTGRMYWVVSFLGIHVFPAVLITLGCLPLWPALTHANPSIGFLDALGFGVASVAIWIEATADKQLLEFRARGLSGSLLRHGLWARVRHPNYLGEMLFWWGLWLLGMGADPARWWTVAGAVAISSLFVFISIPLKDKRMLERRPQYADHMKNTPALIPRLRR